MNTRRVALVTGAWQGLGAAIALRLARDGFDLIVTHLTRDKLADIVRELEAAGARALAVELDLKSQSSVEAAMRAAADRYGHVDVLVNNAGITQRRFALDVSRDEWQDVMDVNLTGTFFMSQQFAKHAVAANREGVVVSLASTHGVVALAERATYGITKGAIIHMTRMLAYEWAPHRIRVNAIAPGTIETPSRAAYFDANPGTREAMLKRVPAGKFGTEADVSGAVSFLAGPDSGFVTGQTLLIDGGLTTY